MFLIANINMSEYVDTMLNFLTYYVVITWVLKL